MLAELVSDYRMRWKRRRLLFRVWRKRRQLTSVEDRTGAISPDAILCFATMRNEMLRLPHFLEHYRKLGVQHFLIIDNGSDDGTGTYLAAQPDVSLWRTMHSYKLSRFGMDWLGWLLWQYGHGHWCLTVDADELFIYPYHDRRDLAALTGYLDQHDLHAFGALMLDLYPKNAVDAQVYDPDSNPLLLLRWFDGEGYRHQVHPKFANQWIQGGPRARVFFEQDPKRAPTLNKTPLVKWHWRYVYVTSTHHMLPRKLNGVFDWPDRNLASGALLHTKFLPDIAKKSEEELGRRQHFENSNQYVAYYHRLIDGVDLWCASSLEYTGWRQLEDLGLLSSGDWK